MSVINPKKGGLIPQTLERGLAHREVVVVRAENLLGAPLLTLGALAWPFVELSWHLYLAPLK